MGSSDSQKAMAVLKNNTIERLRGEDRRSIGQSDQVAEEIENGTLDASLVLQLLLESDDPVVRMRAADVLEKASRAKPNLLDPLRKSLIQLLETAHQQEVRWHLAQMMPRIKTTKTDTKRVMQILEGYLDDRSSIVKTSALQALTDMAIGHADSIHHVRGILENALEAGTPAMKSRAKKLLVRLDKGSVVKLPMSIQVLQKRLECHADPKKKVWWEAYLKHVIEFRGVPMAAIRKEVCEWIPENNRVDLALELLQQPLVEDKLAGILVLAEHVVPSGSPSGKKLLPRVAPLFEQGHIADWNTCDWFCVKFMHRLLVHEGATLAPLVAAWNKAGTLWQRRAAIVSFVNLAPKGDDNWPGFSDMLLKTCASNLKEPERFSQTGVGWVLRELSKAEPDRVAAFVAKHPVSKEAKRMALAKIMGRGRR